MTQHRTADDVLVDIARLERTVIIAHGPSSVTALVTRALRLAALRKEFAEIERNDNDRAR